MSNSYYSDKYSQGDHKSSNYTDFSSNSYGSYSYDQDSSNKKFDDYSNNSGGYSSFDSNPGSSESNFGNFEWDKNQQSNFDGQQKKFDAKQTYQSDSQSFSDSFFTNNPPQQQQQNKYQQQSQQLFQLPKQENQPITPIQPSKPIQKFTVRDVIDLPLSRQQYLKSLSIENLRQEPEYQVIRGRQSVLLGIVDYYEKAIPDAELNSKVKSLKKGKDIKETLWLTSMLGYLLLTGGLQPPGSSFKGVFKSRTHFLIPMGLTALILFDGARTRAKTSMLLKQSRYSPSIDLAMRKFICDSNHKQRIQIFGQS